MASRSARINTCTQAEFVRRVRDGLNQDPRNRTPAFTLVIGSGFSHPLIPTARAMLRDIPWWLYHDRRGDSAAQERPDEIPAEHSQGFTQEEKEAWAAIAAHPESGVKLNAQGQPDLEQPNMVELAYTALMSGRSTGGLNELRLRRRYLRHVSRRIGPRMNLSHLFLASILRAQDAWRDRRPFCRTIFTTNFDPLMQRSLQLVGSLYALSDRPDVLEPPSDDETDAIHLIYAHGSTHRYELLNTKAEISKAMRRNAANFDAYFQRHGVIVVGYGGWSDALMAALGRCPRFDGNLFWVDIHSGAEAPQKLSRSTLALLRKHGDSAFYVPTSGADLLMYELHVALGLGASPAFVAEPIRALITTLEHVQVTGSVSSSRTGAAAGDDTTRDVWLAGVSQSVKETLRALSLAESVFRDPDRVQRAADAAGAGVNAAPARAQEDAQVQQASIGRWMALANEHVAREEWDQARALWEQCIADPGAAPDQVALAHFYRGVLLGRRGLHDDAAADLAAALASSALDAELAITARLEHADRMTDLDRFGDASADYTALLDDAAVVGTRRATVQFLRGWTRMQADDFTGSLADYQLALAHPEATAEQRALAGRGIGDALDALGDKPGAIAAYGRVADMPDVSPEHRARARYARATIYDADLHDDAALLADLDAVIAEPEAPDDLLAKALNRRADVRSRLDRADGALEDRTAVIRLAEAPPAERARALLRRAQLYNERGDTDRARRDLSKVESIPEASANDLALAKFMRAAHHRGARRHDDAIELYTAIVDDARVDAVIRQLSLLHRGQALSEKGELAGAVRDFGQLLAAPEVDPEQRAEALRGRAQALWQQGQRDDARKDWRAVADDASLPAQLRAEALTDQGWYAYEQGDVAELIQHSRAAVALAPTSWTTRFNLALGLLLSGERDAGLDEYLQSLEGCDERAVIEASLRDLEQAVAGRAALAGADAALERFQSKLAALAPAPGD